MHSIQSFLAGLLTVAPLLNHVAAQIGGVCPGPNESQPNPIGRRQKYAATKTTGTVNGTVVILPITYELARSIVPAKYPILQAQYKQWLPFLADDQYPAMLQMELNHDIYHKGVSAGADADFVRASVSFPFVDRLNDGYTAMTYNHEVIISSANTDAQAAFAKYGSVVAPGYYANCNAYEYENGTANLALPPAQRGIDQAAWANTNTDLSNPDIAYRMAPVTDSPYSTDFYYNITNQPLFSDKTTCDNVVRLPSTVVSTGQYVPVHQQGSAAILKPFFTPKKKTVWEDVYGLKLDQSYTEKDHVSCLSLKGFSVNSAP